VLPPCEQNGIISEKAKREEGLGRSVDLSISKFLSLLSTPGPEGGEGGE